MNTATNNKVRQIKWLERFIKSLLLNFFHIKKSNIPKINSIKISLAYVSKMKFFSDNTLLDTKKIITKIEHAIILFSLKKTRDRANKK